jgi:hypothetical protein
MDDGDPAGQPWLPGAGEWMDPNVGRLVSAWDRGDRISATIVNAQMTAETSGMMPIFSVGLAGFILSPTRNTILCQVRGTWRCA